MSLKNIDSFTSRLVFGTIWPNKSLIWALIRHISKKIMFKCIKNSHRHVNHHCWNDHIWFWVSTLFSLCWFEIIIQTTTWLYRVVLFDSVRTHSLEKVEWVCGCFCELLVLMTWNSLDILLKAELNVEQIYKCYQIFVNKIVLIFVRIANFSSSVISADLVWLNRARQLGTVMNKKLGKIEARVGFSNTNDFRA